MATVVLPKLVHKTESIDLNVRHGAILGIGETILALSQTKLVDGKYETVCVGEFVVKKVKLKRNPCR